MGSTNHHRTWGRKPRLVVESRINSSRKEYDELDERSSQTNTEMWFTEEGCPKNTSRTLHSQIPRWEYIKNSQLCLYIP
ncbi:hypothetical protein TNCV_2843311 [Trichonephila clavipes]|nr:hypothetical protein TNCV_2843311 [Trichonephila clavipes]